MKFKIFLLGVLLIFCVAGSAQAQAPQDIWREYQFLKPPFSELRFAYVNFEEPYYSLAFKEIANMQFRPEELTYVLVDMMIRPPHGLRKSFSRVLGSFKFSRDRRQYAAASNRQ